MSILDKFKLEGKVAIVTGASKGIGESMARALGEAGAKVVLSSRKQEALDDLAAEYKAAGIDAVGIAAKVGELEDMQNLVAKTVELYGGVDILINNAAANPVFGPVIQTEEWAFDKIMDVNVKGPFELGKLVHPIMSKRGGGSIINISSVGGVSPESMLGIYSVSKAALVSLTKVMAKEWAADGIRANVICPGFIKTKFSQALWTNKDIMEYVLKDVPAGRIGQPDEMAGLALYLASDAASYTTGGVYLADGGYLI